MLKKTLDKYIYMCDWCLMRKKSPYPAWQKSQFGRPTKYKPEYCDQIIKHFDIPTRTTKQKTIITSKGSKIIEEEVASEFPTMEGFAHKIGVVVDTMLEWRKENPLFSAAYSRAQQLQKNLLIANGTAGLYNPAFTIFVAKNCTDMRDKTEVEHIASPGMIQVSDNMRSLMDRVLGMRGEVIEGEVVVQGMLGDYPGRDE